MVFIGIQKVVSEMIAFTLFIHSAPQSRIHDPHGSISQRCEVLENIVCDETFN